MPNAILDPTGMQGSGESPGGPPVNRAPADRGLTLAPRPADLRGATVGLLENTKQNAALFLRELGQLLVQRHGAAGVLPRTKTAFALPVPEELLEELASGCDVVVTGVGDCGSCSVSAIADGVAFERRGRPAAVICSDAFGPSADAMARAQGAAGYHYLTTHHPVAPLTPAQVRARAVEALPEVVSTLVSVQLRGSVA
jgi:hypothetical protein